MSTFSQRTGSGSPVRSSTRSTACCLARSSMKFDGTVLQRTDRHPNRGHPRAMHDREVVPVGGVLQLDLPVALEPEPVLTLYLQRIAGALLHEPVDPGPGPAQEVRQRL